MFGPVRITSCLVVPFRSMSLGTKSVAKRSTTGWRASTARNSSPSCTCGLVKLAIAAVSGESGQHVQRRQRTRGVLDARRLGRNRLPQGFEDLQLALEDPLVGAEHLLLVFLQRGRREALAAGNRLFALIVGRHRMQVRLRNLDVVAEHAVEADLERVDPGARALALFHLGDHLPSRAADRLQLVELRVHAVARKAAVARERPRLVDERPFDDIPHVREVVELRQQAAEQGRLDFVEHQAEPRDRGDRQAQRHQVARAGGAERHAADEPLDVVNGLQHLAKAAAIRGAKRELLDRVQPVTDPLERDEGTEQPRAQQPAAHGRHRAVDFVEQRSLGTASRCR